MDGLLTTITKNSLNSVRIKNESTNLTVKFIHVVQRTFPNCDHSTTVGATDCFILLSIRHSARLFSVL